MAFVWILVSCVVSVWLCGAADGGRFTFMAAFFGACVGWLISRWQRASQRIDRLENELQAMREGAAARSRAEPSAPGRSESAMPSRAEPVAMRTEDFILTPTPPTPEAAAPAAKRTAPPSESTTPPPRPLTLESLQYSAQPDRARGSSVERERVVLPPTPA